MKRVKIGFSGKSVSDQVEKARNIVGNMTGNANFTTPSPALATVTAAVDILEIAYNESRNRDKNKVAIMKLRRKELLDLILLLGAYVQTASEGDEEKILSSAFEVVKERTPIPPAGAVQNLRLAAGNNTGIIAARWDLMPGALVYVVELANDPLPVVVPLPLPGQPNTGFAIKGVSSKTRFEIVGLNPGSKYWVRVAAIDKFGIAQYSDPALLMAV